jgi:hypothetical protein
VSDEKDPKKEELTPTLDAEEANPDKELWREAWEWRQTQEKERRALRIDELKALRSKLHNDSRTVETALSELEGRGDWTQLMKPLEDFGWLNTEPPPRKALLEYEDDCVLPLGKVGFFVGEGGIGKSWALTQLAISVCTGTPWFNKFKVPEYATGGVVMAMGEEDPDEMHRRIHNIVQHLGLAAHHYSMLEKCLWPMPLSGHFMEFLEEGERSYQHERFEQIMEESAPEQGWKLIVLDPASRFMGMDAEKDNAYATRFVQLLERLTMLPGRPSVICAHHTTKAARTSNTGARSVAARGASALTDGARWQGNLFVPFDDNGSESSQENVAVFQITKSNYGPKPPAVYLTRRPGSGVLVPFAHDDGGFAGVTGHTGNFDGHDAHTFSSEDTEDFKTRQSEGAKKTRVSPSKYGLPDNFEW